MAQGRSAKKRKRDRKKKAPQSAKKEPPSNNGGKPPVKTPAPKPKGGDHPRSRRNIQWLGWFGLVIGLISLVSLVQLKTRFDVSPTEPRREDGDTIPRFAIVNAGYLELKDVSSACYLWHIVTTQGRIGNTLSAVQVPPAKSLGPGEGFTVDCDLGSLGPQHPAFSQIDIAVVVYYRLWFVPYFRSHKLIRFVGRPTADLKNTIWDKQPAADLEADFDKWLDKYMVTFPRDPTLAPQ